MVFWSASPVGVLYRPNSGGSETTESFKQVGVVEDPMGTVVAVVGTIPGAGATTAVATLGAALAERSQRVALVDATQEGSRLTEVVGTDGDGALGDALRRGTTLAEVQADGPRGIAVFPADDDTSWGSMRPDAIADAYETMRDRFDVVLVDCGSTLTPAAAPWLGHADDALIVTDPDVAGTVDETAGLARAFDVDVTGILANRVPPKEVREALTALDATGLRVLAVLPEDRAVGAAAEAGTSVFVHDPDSAISRVAWRFAEALLSGEHEQPIVPQGTLAVAGGGGASAGAPDRAGATDATGSTSTGGDASSGSAPSGPSGPSGPTAPSTPSSSTDSPDGTLDPEQPTGTAVGEPEASGRTRRDAGSTGDRSPREDEPESESRPTGPAGDHERTISQILSGSEDDGDRSSDVGEDDRGPDRFEFGDVEHPDREPDDEDAELSDEEIEAVFKQTMDRVKQRREGEETDDE